MRNKEKDCQKFTLLKDLAKSKRKFKDLEIVNTELEENILMLENKLATQDQKHQLLFRHCVISVNMLLTQRRVSKMMTKLSIQMTIYLLLPNVANVNILLMIRGLKPTHSISACDFVWSV